MKKDFGIFFVAACGLILTACSVFGFDAGPLVKVPPEARFFSSMSGDSGRPATGAEILFFQSLTNYPEPRQMSWLVATVIGREGAFNKTRIAIVQELSVLAQWHENTNSTGTKLARSGYYDSGQFIPMSSNVTLLALVKESQRGFAGMDVFLLKKGAFPLVFKDDQQPQADCIYLFADVEGDTIVEMLRYSFSEKAENRITIWRWQNENEQFTRLLPYSETVANALWEKGFKMPTALRIELMNPREVPPAKR